MAKDKYEDHIAAVADTIFGALAAVKEIPKKDTYPAETIVNVNDGGLTFRVYAGPDRDNPAGICVESEHYNYETNELAITIRRSQLTKAEVAKIFKNLEAVQNSVSMGLIGKFGTSRVKCGANQIYIPLEKIII